jgi:dihydropteroate synthase
MATVTRVNGLKATVDKLALQRCAAYKVIVKKTTGGVAAVDLRAEDDAVDEVVEQIVKELNPIAYYVVDSSAGIIYVLMDKTYQNTIFDASQTAYAAERAEDAAELQTRIRQIGIDPSPATTTSIGPNDIDISSTTVEVAVSMTFGV